MHTDARSTAILASKRTTRAAAKTLSDSNPNVSVSPEPQTSDLGSTTPEPSGITTPDPLVNPEASAASVLADTLSRKPQETPSSDSEDGSPPPLIDVSDDDDTDIDIMSETPACHVQEKWNCPPSLTAGPGLSSILLEAFFTAAENAFDQMSTPDADCTKTVANRMLHPKIATWFSSNHAEVNALEWSAFKKKVCAIALGADWDVKERRTLELATQSSSESFSIYFDCVNLANTPLSITGKSFPQSELRSLLTRGLNEHFRMFMEPHLEDAAAVADFYDWHNFIVKKQQLADAQYNSLLDAAREINANSNASQNKRSHHSAFGDNPCGANTTSKKPNSRSDSGSCKENARVIPLTNACRELIKNNNSCNVCRNLFTTCKA
jgi:hypothetical protein